MNGDVLGWRRKFGIVTPSTNTVVQPECDEMRPPGVTNHVSRMFIPDDPVESDADFNELIRRIDASLEDAVDSVMTCKPDYLVLGISSESIWGGGMEPSRRIRERVRARAGDIGVAQAADALARALKVLGVRRRVSVITPYFPVADPHIREYIDAIGYETARTAHLCCCGPVVIAHSTPRQLRDALLEVDGDDVEAIIQFGANLAFARQAADAERWLDKPVIAVNTATYWHALRESGIPDPVRGFGALLERH
jgi:maleate isomerase